MFCRDVWRDGTGRGFPQPRGCGLRSDRDGDGVLGCSPAHGIKVKITNPAKKSWKLHRVGEFEKSSS